MAEFVYAGDAGAFKECTKCGECKPIQLFPRASTGAFGLRGDCSECRRAYSAQWYECLSDSTKTERAKTTIKRRAYNSDYYQKNKDRHRKNAAKWLLLNPDKHRESTRLAMRKRRATPQGRLESVVSRGIHRGLTAGTKAGRRTFDLLGYTVGEMKAHLERMFEAGMSWENYGVGWHIDHIVPLSAHNYETPDHLDFQRAWSLSNLRPMWARDNISKGARLLAPFQPSLAI